MKQKQNIMSEAELASAVRDALIADLAHALWRSKLRTRLKTLDDCRLAARQLVAHLERCRYRMAPGDPLRPHGEVSGDGSGSGDNP